jgi:hypothetical protein
VCVWGGEGVEKMLEKLVRILTANSGNAIVPHVE